MADTDMSLPVDEADAALVIPRDGLRSRVDSRDPQLVLVDVLTRDSYEDAHIPGAINIPYATLSEAVASDVLRDRDADIVVYCGGGT